MDNISVFISHASVDKELGEALVTLFQKALRLPSGTILYTSDPAYGIVTGATVDSTLRDKALEAETFLALITPASLRSSYVTFEIGARWGTKKHLAPIAAGGIDIKELGAPITNLHISEAKSAAQMLNLVTELGKQLKRKPEPAPALLKEVERVVQLGSLGPPPISTIQNLCRELAKQNGDFNLIPLLVNANDVPIANLDTSFEGDFYGTGAILTRAGLVWRNASSIEIHQLTWVELKGLEVIGNKPDNSVLIGEKGKKGKIEMSGSNTKVSDFAKLLRRISTLAG